MTLHLERVPFDSTRLPAWLERHLVGDHLGELIEELLAVRPIQGSFDFDRWFSPHKEQILSTGLSRLPRKSLRQLLAYPPALRQLQTAILLGGGRFWDEVPRSKGFYRRLNATRPTITPATSSPQQTSRVRSKEPELVPLVSAPPVVPIVKRGLPGWLVIVTVIVTALVSGVAVLVLLQLLNRGE